MNEPVQRQQIGYDLAGNPVYATWPATGLPQGGLSAPAAPLQPIKAHPWGAYIAGGCLGLAALVVVGVIAVALLIGLSIALVVLAIAVVALVICLLVLRSMWRDHQKGR